MFDEVSVADFHDWGWTNGFSEEKEARFDKVQIFHEKARKNNPEQHKMRRVMNSFGTCEHWICSCGFEYEVDMS